MVATALAAIAAGSWSLLRRDADGPPRFDLQQGQRIAYDVTLRTRGWISPEIAQAAFVARSSGAANGDRLPLEIVIDGRFEATVVAGNSDGRGWTLEGRLLAGRYVVAGVAQASAEALARPLRFVLEPDGRVTAPSPEDLGQDHARLALRTLVLGLQVRLPEEVVGNWTGREDADDGVYTVAYQVPELPRDGVWRVRKTWHRFERSDRRAQHLDRLERRVVRSSGEAGFRAGGAWIDEVDWSVTVEEYAADVRFASLRTELTAQRAEPGAHWGPRVATTTGPIPTIPGGRPSTPDATGPSPSGPESIAGVNAAQAVAKFLERQRGEYVPARDALLAWIRGSPAAPGALAVHLEREGPTLDRDEELRLWRFLAEAGTTAAQDALATVLAADGFGARSLALALAHVPIVRNPHAALIRAVWDVYDQTPDTDDGAAQDRRTTALLAIGALGHEDQADAETARSIAEGLVQRLRAARDEGGRRRVLAAMANQGHATAVGTVETFFSDPEPTVRAAAVAALRRTDTPAATAALLAAWARERDLDVRATILVTLRERGADPRVRDWALAALASPLPPRLLVGVVHLAGGYTSDDPRVVDALRALLATKPDRAVRRALYDYVKPD